MSWVAIAGALMEAGAGTAAAGGTAAGLGAGTAAGLGAGAAGAAGTAAGLGAGAAGAGLTAAEAAPAIAAEATPAAAGIAGDAPLGNFVGPAATQGPAATGAVTPGGGSWVDSAGQFLKDSLSPRIDGGNPNQRHPHVIGAGLIRVASFSKTSFPNHWVGAQARPRNYRAN
jgi:hypothetical protein